MSVITANDDGTIVQIKLSPRASDNKIVGIMDNAVKIRLQAPPVDGKANKALIKFIAKLLKVPASGVQIISGDTNRNKRIYIRNIPPETVRQKLGLQQSM